MSIRILFFVQDSQNFDFSTLNSVEDDVIFHRDTSRPFEKLCSLDAD